MLSYQQAQEGIATVSGTTLHKGLRLASDASPFADAAYDAIKSIPDKIWNEICDAVANEALDMLFTPKQIEEWKKGGYPAIVCKDQSLPRWHIKEPQSMDGRHTKRIYEQALKDMADFLRIVKEE